MAIVNAEMYEALLLAHVPKDKAKAAAAEVATAQGFASESDVLESDAPLQPEIEKRSVQVFPTEAKPSGESDKRLDEISNSLAVLKFAVLFWESIVIALLVKLVFFP